MGWSEQRIEEYREGQPATWLERRMLDHANPVHFALGIAAAAGLTYGLWTRNWRWIFGSLALSSAGHLYCASPLSHGTHHPSPLPEGEAVYEH